MARRAQANAEDGRRTLVDPKAVGRRITQARLEAGLHQREVAERVGVITRAYQNYEAGTRVPWRKLEPIAAALGTSKDWLLRGDDGDPPLPQELDARLDAIESLLREILERLPPRS